MDPTFPDPLRAQDGFLLRSVSTTLLSPVLCSSMPFSTGLWRLEVNLFALTPDTSRHMMAHIVDILLFAFLLACDLSLCIVCRCLPQPLKLGVSLELTCFCCIAGVGGNPLQLCVELSPHCFCKLNHVAWSLALP